MRGTKFIKLVILSIACVALFFSYAQTTNSQSTSSEPAVPQEIQDQLQYLLDLNKSQISDSITLKSYPDTPKPLEKTTLQLQSLGPDLNSSYITWIVNGVVLRAGKGIKNLEITLGEAGGASNIHVIIEAQNGLKIDKDLVLHPAQVDLVWESESYTPPFYKGKALYISQGKVKITAIPDVIDGGVKVSPKNLIYKWKKDGTVLSNMSGYGKNSIVLNGSIITKPLSVSVEVSTVNGSVRALQEISIKVADPTVVIYESNPLYGIMYNNAIVNEIAIKSKEVTLIAIPYFFSGYSALNSNLINTWSLNNKTIEGERGNVITFRSPEESGISRVSFGIESKDKILQSARDTIMIKFDGALEENQ